MVRQVWDELHQNYQGVKTDQFTIMPNHVHGIILLPVGAGPSACTDVHARHNSHAKGQPRGIAPLISLPDVVHQFKSYTTARYLFGVALLNWPPFHDKLWQHNYERIIRNEQELKRIRKYIRDNPLQWHLDKDNPSNTKP
jgi:REP element-mobilizing transposase RayT